MVRYRKSKGAPTRRKVVTRACAVANIPEHELWLHEPKARSDLRRALAWARRNPIDKTFEDRADMKVNPVAGRSRSTR